MNGRGGRKAFRLIPFAFLIFGGFLFVYARSYVTNPSYKEVADPRIIEEINLVRRQLGVDRVIDIIIRENILLEQPRVEIYHVQQRNTNQDFLFILVNRQGYAAMRKIDNDALRAILAHEIGHVVRGDLDFRNERNRSPSYCRSVMRDFYADSIATALTNRRALVRALLAMDISLCRVHLRVVALQKLRENPKYDLKIFCQTACFLNPEY